MNGSFETVERDVPSAAAVPITGYRVPFQRSAVFSLLAIHAALVAYSALRCSPTLNEPAHLVAGISHWEFGRFDAYRVNPPLVRMIAALPVLAVGYEAEWDGFYNGPGIRPEFRLHNSFVAMNGDRIFWLTTIARWACLPFSVIGGLVCFLWARDLFGPLAGLLASGCWCFSPTILAHASLITPDAHGAALGLAAGYAFWNWLRSPTWARAVFGGVLLGLAALAKTTLAVFFPLWPLLWIAYRWSNGDGLNKRDCLREGGGMAVSLLIALNVLNLGYGFEESFTKLGDFDFVSEQFAGGDGKIKRENIIRNRFAGTILGGLPVPVPANYLRGIDIQLNDFEGKKSYLLGEFSEHGWWYYYLVAVVVKEPLGTWLAAVIALAGRGIGMRTAVVWRDDLVVLIPAVAVFALVSSQTKHCEHMRYVLPAFPFAFVWTSRAAVRLRSGRAFWGVITASAFVWSAASSLTAYPQCLGYFNELAGGPRGGHAYLIHSNIDWGQDLLNLKSWMKDHREA